MKLWTVSGRARQYKRIGHALVYSIRKRRVGLRPNMPDSVGTAAGAPVYTFPRLAVTCAPLYTAYNASQTAHLHVVHAVWRLLACLKSHFGAKTTLPLLWYPFGGNY